ncbi:hypothetical protein FRC09_019912 [Ceratobasidium sp. 395]|nr:hypothetical protein FRC09_019912 [Ceratobasidium sp. 395]
MLKGWAMLSDECTNENCWAIPLVRPPRARPGAQPDPRKECVICGTVYITDENGELVAQPAPMARGTAAPSGSQRSQETSVEPPSRTATNIVQEVSRNQLTNVAPETPALVKPLPPTSITAFSSPPQPPSTNVNAFSSATGALQGALDSLSQRLIQITMASNIDVKQVKDTAEAMDVVMKSLQTARQLSGGV